jgi:4-hydroxy-4-methyl-2-oxoglutarate aldolase
MKKNPLSRRTSLHSVWIVCTTYKTYGSVGLITSGTGRDLDQVRKIGYPVFTNSYCYTLNIHEPVREGGVMIYPDNLLHADVNGVITIPITCSFPAPM